MDDRLLRYYERELLHLRDMGGEFAAEFPKIAGRLGLESQACADPYVERLLEGFSFLAARIQLKIDAEFPRFTQHLLEVVYPHYLSPTPSMIVAQMNPATTEGSLKEGYLVPRGTGVRSLLGKGDQTSCEYRTAHDVTLWPIELTQADCFAYSGNIDGIVVNHFGEIKSGLRLRLKCAAGLKFSELPIDRLPLYLRGSDSLPARLLELILSSNVAMMLKSVNAAEPWHELIGPGGIEQCGFDDDEALLPYGPRSFHGYRLLHEYFAFPQRFMFTQLSGLARGMSRCDEQEIDLYILLDTLDAELEQVVGPANFGLHCTPAINLFEKRADRVHVSEKRIEYHVVPDRTRPLDYEVYRITSVTGHGSGPNASQSFKPFFESNDIEPAEKQQAFFQSRRERRVLSSVQRKQGARTSYEGSEVFLSLVDAQETPHRPDLRQLGIETLCTNRDLPLSMPLGGGRTDFTVDGNAPVASIRCVAGPTAPVSSHADGKTAWRLISHLSLNYLTLVDSDKGQGASGLRELLRLYCPVDDATAIRQIEGLRSIESRRVVRRIPTDGPITYGRGVQVRLTMDDAAFDYSVSGAFLLSAVLDRFLAKYVSINSFTETVAISERRGEIMHWPTRLGQCEIL